MPLMSAKRCNVCWPPGCAPPYEWQRSEAPAIPQKKCELIEELATYIPEIPLTKLCIPELKQLFRKHVRGEKHPCDPTQAMSGLKKCELQQICQHHHLPDSGSKGALCLSLREHWAGQCSLAKSEGEVSESSSQSEDQGSSGSMSSWSCVGKNQAPASPFQMPC